MRALLVEDDAVVSRASVRLLRYALIDVDVHVVASVAGAKAALADHAFDLVLCDFDIVGGTGGDVLAWLREHRPEAVGQFVFFTGNDTGEPARLHGKIIAKGVWPAEFAEQLRVHLGIADR